MTIIRQENNIAMANNSDMAKMFGILIQTLLLLSINEYVMSEEIGNVFKDSALNLMKTGLEQFSQGIEKMMLKRFNGDNTIVETKLQDMIETIKKDIVDEQKEFIKSLSSQSSAKDEKIIELLSTIQTEQRLLRQEIVSIRSSFSGNPNTKTSGRMETTGYKASALKANESNGQNISDLQNSVYTLSTEYSKEKLKRETLTDLLIFYNESFPTMQAEQRLLKQELVSITTNLTETIDEKFSYLVSTIHTGHQNLSQEMVSVTTNLSSIDEIQLIQEISNLNKAFVGLSDRLQNEQAAMLSMIDSVVLRVNKTMSVCSRKIGEKIDNVETNVINVIQDELENFALVLGNNSEKSEKALGNLRNSTLFVVEQFSTGEAINILRNVEMIGQSLLKVHDILGFDCAENFEKHPYTRGRNGVYNIIGLSYKPTSVYCDMTTDYGRWTVIQRRINGSVDFYRNWTEYKNGFGNADHEYWIGNDMLHRLTSLKPQELRVDMERFNGEKAYAVYSRFSVGNETSKYKLEVQGYSGNAACISPRPLSSLGPSALGLILESRADTSCDMEKGDSLSTSNTMKFSTPDQDNDNNLINCATWYRSAGWFDHCYHANPNGQYTDSKKPHPKYIVWYHWKNSYISLKSIQLMIRPRT